MVDLPLKYHELSQSYFREVRPHWVEYFFLYSLGYFAQLILIFSLTVFEYLLFKRYFSFELAITLIILSINFTQIVFVNFRTDFDFNILLTSPDGVSDSQYSTCLWINSLCSALCLALNWVFSWKCCCRIRRTPFQLISFRMKRWDVYYSSHFR